jgi:hypothetical protein
MTRSEKNIGQAGEQLAKIALRQIGVQMVERIATPVKLLPSKRDKGAFHVIWGETVSGDFRGIAPGGISVLAEVKTIMDRNLRWSDLREHQPGRLDEHAENGGISLLVWVNEMGVFVMNWAALKEHRFGAGDGIEPATAKAYNVVDIRQCTEVTA